MFQWYHLERTKKNNVVEEINYRKVIQKLILYFCHKMLRKYAVF